MTALVTLPNAEALVSAFLRAQPEIVALVGDRVYTAIPAETVYPLIRVTQYDDSKITSRVLWLVRFSIQIEAWGGSKGQAFNACATAQAALDQRGSGAHAQGVVTGVQFGSMRDLPDTAFSPAKPRFLTTAYLFVHPNP